MTKFKERKLGRVSFKTMHTDGGFVRRFHFLAENYKAWCGLKLTFKLRQYHQYAVVIRKKTNYETA